MCRPFIIFIQIFNLIVACLLLYVFYLYNASFHSPLTSIFLILSIAFLLTFFYAFRRARVLTQKVLFAASEKAKSEQLYKRRESGNDDFLKMIKYESLTNFFANYFFIEGDYYLLKLNVSEVMEHVNQLINIFTIYNCNMSVYFVWTIFIVLVLESLHNAFVLFRGNSHFNDT